MNNSFIRRSENVIDSVYTVANEYDRPSLMCVETNSICDEILYVRCDLSSLSTAAEGREVREIITDIFIARFTCKSV